MPRAPSRQPCRPALQAAPPAALVGALVAPADRAAHDVPMNPREDLAVAADRHETPTERLDRNWNEILQELRVTQTGIQILTGFLLTVPFQSRFADLSATQRVIYLVLVLLAAVTTGIMVAPVSLHRMLFRRRAKSALVTEADRLMRVGLAFLALVVAGVVLLVFDVVTTRAIALTASLTLFAALVVGWFVLPKLLARSSRRVSEEQTPEPEAHT